MAGREIVLPLTDFQRTLLALLAQNRSPDSYLAGGTALHFSPTSTRYSKDLDFFHDSVERVASAYEKDADLLRHHGYEIEVLLSQPGFVRGMVTRHDDATRVDWAHDSAWRFMPPVRDELGGFMLHETDLAVNKVLALAGRDEPRDYVDVLFIHNRILPLGALCWAAVGKDPGFTPLSLLELLKRRSRFRPEQIDRLDLTEPFDLVIAKTTWLDAIERAETFVMSRPDDEFGCLYYSESLGAFGLPDSGTASSPQNWRPHFGSPGGILPQPSEQND